MATSVQGERTTPSPVLFVNPGSGLRQEQPGDLEARFGGFDVREVEGPDLGEAVQEAVANGVPVVAIAGGDGSVRTAAEILAGTAVALLVVPGGTFNHFAKALGILDLDIAEQAARGGRTEVVDVGVVNDHCFVNNATVGWYTSLVRARERWERRLPRIVARLVALVQQLPNARRFELDVGGDRQVAWIVWVGNGRIRTDLGELGSRESLADDVVDVWVARASGTASRARQLIALFRGRLEQSPLIEHRVASAMELRFKRPRVHVALDGEVMTLTTPLSLTVRSGALTVLVPPTPPPATTTEPA